MTTAGRPKSSDKERKTKQVKLSLTEDEHNMLMAMAERHNKKIGEFARDIVVDYITGVHPF